MNTAHSALEPALRLALQGEQFLLYYQPKASCRSGAVTGFEALLRWNHPTRGMVGPAEFIPVLEHSGMIQEVGIWVLRTACLQLKAWIAAGYGQLHMAVNLSMRQLMDADFPDQVHRILCELELPAAQLELELTESMLMHDVAQIEILLHRLKALGLQLSIDDFGTGYSSLSYLKRLPIDTLKVDRSFVQDITTDPNDASITRAIIGMAHSLKMSVVAEGVETDAQLSTLAAEQCETVQGYFLSKPLPAHQASAFLDSGWRIPAHLLSRPTKERTLLLVDDEDSIVLALKRLLRREGYRILSASSGAEGLELLAKNDVDVVLSDQRMPEMTGEEFLRRTKELYPHTVRIVLSGYADMQSITNAINQGAVYKFMSKPWDEETLKKGIQEAFSRKEKNDAHLRKLQEFAAANDSLNRDKHSLSLLLDEQSHAAMVSQVALQLAQENLHQLPVPVIGLDPSGLVVLRNEAFYALGIAPDACMALAAQLSAPSSSAPFTLAFCAPGGTHWQIVARHLLYQGQHRGTVLAFFPQDLLHV
jgi:EAL domain-containing protein (putative c-di-GMP-specific phosphodiesterase class I)/CheY-like chemotaxis protein